MPVGVGEEQNHVLLKEEGCEGENDKCAKGSRSDV